MKMLRFWKQTPKISSMYMETEICYVSRNSPPKFMNMKPNGICYVSHNTPYQSSCILKMLRFWKETSKISLMYMETEICYVSRKAILNFWIWSQMEFVTFLKVQPINNLALSKCYVYENRHPKLAPYIRKLKFVTFLETALLNLWIWANRNLLRF